MDTLTAAPWQYHPLGKIHFEPNKNMHLVCNPRENHSIAVAINENDARLIASAPDLLAVLQEAVRVLDYAADALDAPEASHFRATIADARAAIAKATGENA